MSLRVAYTIILISSIALLLPAIARGEDFTAEYVSVDSTNVTSGTMATSGGDVRMETSNRVVITRTDKKTTWVMYPGEKKYAEEAFRFNDAAAATRKVPGMVERTFVCDDLIDKRAAKKYRVTYLFGNSYGTLFQWIDTDTEIPLKTAAVNGSWSISYKNIHPELSPKSIFMLPLEYRKFIVFQTDSASPPPTEIEVNDEE